MGRRGWSVAGGVVINSNARTTRKSHRGDPMAFASVATR